MKIFIFERLEKVSENYHEGGGLVIIAKSINHAKEIIKEDKDIQITDDEWLSVEFYILSNKNAKPKFWVMPDAGCC